MTFARIVCSVFLIAAVCSVAGCVPDSCGNCEGCCQAGVCKLGTSSDACGSNGLVCQACGASASCVLGQCTEAAGGGSGGSGGAGGSSGGHGGTAGGGV